MAGWNYTAPLAAKPNPQRHHQKFLNALFAMSPEL